MTDGECARTPSDNPTPRSVQFYGKYTIQPKAVHCAYGVAWPRDGQPRAFTSDLFAYMQVGTDSLVFYGLHSCTSRACGCESAVPCDPGCVSVLGLGCDVMALSYLFVFPHTKAR